LFQKGHIMNEEQIYNTICGIIIAAGICTIIYYVVFRS